MEEKAVLIEKLLVMEKELSVYLGESYQATMEKCILLEEKDEKQTIIIQDLQGTIVDLQESTD